MSNPLFSYLIVTRNDGFCGDGIGRLRKVLASPSLIGSSYEVLVLDCGSDGVKVKDALGSSGPQVRHIYIPREVTDKFKSRFPEIPSLNLGLRLARAPWIGQIDQDIIVGRRFVEWAQSALPSMEPAAFFSGRRDLPEGAHQEDDSLPVNDDGVREGQAFWSAGTGIQMAHRDIWHRVRGWQEQLIGRLHMQRDLCTRLSNVTTLHDLGKLLNYPFYHQWHPRPSETLPSNQFLNEGQLRRWLKGVEYLNGEDWGLRDFAATVKD